MKMPSVTSQKALLAAAVLILTFLQTAMAEKALPVIASPVEVDVFVDRIEALGTLYANETAQLSSTITETISEVRFDDGQRVKRGDILVTMTNREQLAQLDEARAAVEEADRQHRRVEELVSKGTESEAILDQRRREIDVAQARLRAVQSRLEDRIIKAPFDGVVGLRHVSVGALLTPGTPIVTLHDDSVMKLDFTVPETLLATVQPGLEVIARSRAFADHTFEGRVDSIDNQIDPVTRAFRVRALIPNPDHRLRPGMLMQVELIANPREALVVPEEVLTPLGRDNYVFVAEPDADAHRAVRRAVTIGARRQGEVEILSGLEPDELVITHGGIRLASGQAVRIRAIDDGQQSLRALLVQEQDD